MENKLEVGMYVRFKKGKVAYIRKLLEVIHNFETFDVYRIDKEYFDYEEKDYFDIVYPDEILKSSYNITDLIEVGDFITFKKNNLYIEYPCRVYGSYNEEIGETELYADNENLKDIEFTSILTHEQFEEYSYKIGE